MKLTGAKILIECLVEQGIDTVFGYPGGSVLNIYDALYENEHRVRHILTSHEQGAAHAADGYARASGKVGVVIATSGPGATNLVTGIATAYMDSIPMVAITGNVPVNLLGRDSFQEVDIAGITMPVTKHNFIVKDVNQLADTIRKAFEIARSGRPGPVLVDIPKDVTAMTAEYEPSNGKPSVASFVKKRHKATQNEFAEAIALINKSTQPMILAGGGVISSGANDELMALAKKLDAPVAITLMGHGAFPSTHELCTGMIGMHGTRASNMAARQADLLIAVGTRFSDRVISDATAFAKGANILHLDVDAAEIGKNVKCYKSLLGDLKSLLGEILPKVTEKKNAEWKIKVVGWKTETPASKNDGVKLTPKWLLETIQAKVGEDAIVTTEVGQHQIWTAQYYPLTKPRTFLTSGGLGTMGFGTGAAMGAQTAKPDAQVVHIAGDGSFRMNCNELSTIANYGLPLLIIIMNNGTLGMVRQWQSLFYKRRYSQTTLDRPPDFCKLAEAYGVAAWRAPDQAAFTKAIDEALAERKPALIDCRIDIDEAVLPIVPPGRPFEEQIMETIDN